MELLPLVCLCLLSCSGDADRVVVEEDSDAVLPCSFSPKEDINKFLTKKVFDWKKDSVEDVFTHYSDGRTNQGPQFIGRVSHFEDQLQNGDASIKITKTKMADSGNYSCIFPHLQTFYIELVVDQVLTSWGASEPYLNIVKTNDGRMLQCKVRGASPKPRLEWRDSSGKKLKAEEPKVTERGDIILRAALTKTDTFRCVVTQEEISHQIYDDIDAVYGSNTGAIVGGVAGGAGVIILVLVVVVIILCCKLRGSRANIINGPTVTKLVPMN